MLLVNIFHKVRIQRAFRRIGYIFRRLNPLCRNSSITNGLLLQEKRKNHKRRMVIFSIGILVLLILMLVAVWHPRFGKHTTQSSAASITVLQEQTLGQLVHIEEQLQALKLHANSSEEPSHDTSRLDAQLVQIAQTLNTLSTQDDSQKTQTLITEGNRNISERIDQLQTLLEKIKNQVTPKRYLSPSALPFVVKDIIGINGVVKVVIADRDRSNYIPLAEQESLGDWRVVSVSYDPKEVVFENLAKQSVKVNLSH